MTALVHKLGLSKNLSFHDVFSIDDPDLLAFIPRPASALLLVFPVSKSYETYRVEEDSKRDAYEGKGPDQPVIWYRQTIGNACGLMGLLHAVSNGPARQAISTRIFFCLAKHAANYICRSRLRSSKAHQWLDTARAC
jgi:ubiquitin carboxyl-terminal hydrolase L3